MATKINHHALSPKVLIGKNGLTDGSINEIISFLKREKVIKVKFMSNFPGDKAVAIKQILESTGAKKVHAVGGVLVIERGASTGQSSRLTAGSAPKAAQAKVDHDSADSEFDGAVVLDTEPEDDDSFLDEEQ